VKVHPDKKLIPCVRATILQQWPNWQPRTVERAMDRSLEVVEIVGYARGWSNPRFNLHKRPPNRPLKYRSQL
jgi:hypothetical protein